MTQEASWTKRRLEPLRDLHAADLLERYALAIDGGAQVTPEPLARGRDGRLLRTGRLHLPFRRDLQVLTGGKLLHPRVNTPIDPTADPRPGAIYAGAFTLSTMPFQWQAAELRLTGDMSGFVWAPLRLWFLEWVQPRRIEEAPDLLGAVHAMSDPQPLQDGARMRIDFGSAPPGCVLDLLDALSMTGAVAAAIGPAPEAL